MDNARQIRRRPRFRISGIICAPNDINRHSSAYFRLMQRHPDLRYVDMHIYKKKRNTRAREATLVEKSELVTDKGEKNKM